MIDPAWVSALSAILFIIGLGGAFYQKERNYRFDVYRAYAECG